MRTIDIESDAHRAELRVKHVGGSEIAALFDASPYITRWMLFQAKAGRAPLPPADNNRVAWGELLEPAIAEGVTRAMRWQLLKCTTYAVHDNVPGMGCSVDYQVIDHEDGPGLVEIKNVDWLAWRDGWSEERAPLHIELQVQHQLAVTGHPWGAIAALVGGNELRIYPRRPDAKAIGAIEAAVSAFWAAVGAGEAPDPFGAPAENETIKALWPQIDATKTVDLTGDEEAYDLARQLAWAKNELRAPSRIYDAARIKLLARIGDAGRVMMPGASVKIDKRRALKIEIIDGATPVFASPSSPLI